MGCLELFVGNKALGYWKHFREVLAQLGTFEHYFTFDHSVAGTVTVMLASGEGHDCKAFYKTDPLFWCLHNLYHSERDFLANPAILFGFLDYWLEKDTTTFEEKSRLEPRLLKDLSVLAAAHEIVAAVRKFRPLFSYVDVSMAKEKCSGRSSWRCMTPSLTEEDLPQNMGKELVEALKLVERNPFPQGKRDEEWLIRAHEVRKYSLNFWARAKANERWYLATCNYTRYTEKDKADILALLSLGTTPEHLESLKVERERILATTSRPKPETPELAPYSGWPSHDTVQSIPSVLPEHKEKVKTRRDGITTMSILLEEPQLQVSDEPVSTPTLLIKPESIRVLSRLFPSTTEEYAAKPLDWKSFVIAMEDAGLFASQSGGSAVTFAKQGMGRIVFHKPHPIAKVDQAMLQCWGKRMRKWFGWERETFVDAKAANGSS